MKRLAIVLIITLHLACKQKQQATAKPYFEGIVEFKIDLSGSEERVTIARKIFGTTAKTFIKEGNVSRIFYDDKGIIITRELQSTDSLKQYVWHGDSDTVYVTDLSRSVSYKAIGMKDIAAVQILGKVCKAVEIKTEYYTSSYSEPEYLTTLYYFDPTYLLPPSLYKGVRYGSYEEIFAKCPYVTVGTKTLAGNDLQFSMIATKITAVKMDDVYFKLPKNKTLIASF